MEGLLQCFGIRWRDDITVDADDAETLYDVYNV